MMALTIIARMHIFDLNIYIFDSNEMPNSNRVTKSYVQFHPFNASDVFPLLCPENETLWLDGWDYKMVYSESGFAELGCVFSTSHHSQEPTMWVVTNYDPILFKIAFARHSPNKNIVFINIEVSLSQGGCQSHISYQYTALTQVEEEYLQSEFDSDFINDMEWWEKSLNHYLAAKTILRHDLGA